MNIQYTKKYSTKNSATTYKIIENPLIFTSRKRIISSSSSSERPIPRFNHHRHTRKNTKISTTYLSPQPLSQKARHPHTLSTLSSPLPTPKVATRRSVLFSPYLSNLSLFLSRIKRRSGICLSLSLTRARARI